MPKMNTSRDRLVLRPQEAVVLIAGFIIGFVFLAPLSQGNFRVRAAHDAAPYECSDGIVHLKTKRGDSELLLVNEITGKATLLHEYPAREVDFQNVLAASASGELYSIDEISGSPVLVILETDGTITPVGRVVDEDGRDIVDSFVAMNFSPLDGKIYALTSPGDKLYSIDPATAVATKIDDFDPADQGDLVINRDGELVYVDEVGGVFVYDLDSGSLDEIGELPRGRFHSTALLNGVYYALDVSDDAFYSFTLDPFSFTLIAEEGPFSEGDASSCPLELVERPPREEIGFALCTNGRDDDGDGATDLEDDDCADFRPRLTVFKEVINDDGGMATSSDFIIHIFGPDRATSTFPGSFFGTTFTYSATGTYFVFEDSRDGYEPRFSTDDVDDDCHGDLGAGDDKSCRIINDDIAPPSPPPPPPPATSTLRVIKRVINDSGREADPADFTLAVVSSEHGTTTFPGSTEGRLFSFLTGTSTFAVSEAATSTYSTGFDGRCSGTIVPGERLTCTVINDDIAPGTPPPPACSDGLDNDADGKIDADDPGCWTDPLDRATYVPSDDDESGEVFPACADGIDNDGDGLIDFPADPGCTSASDSDETNPPPAPPGDGGGGPAPGAENTTALCTDRIDNDGDGLIDMADSDCHPRLALFFNVINNNGGQIIPSDYDVSVEKPDGSSEKFPGSAEGTIVFFSATGTYSVSISDRSGYSENLSADCSGTILEAQSKTCTIIADDDPPAQAAAASEGGAGGGGGGGGGGGLATISGAPIAAPSAAGGGAVLGVAITAPQLPAAGVTASPSPRIAGALVCSLNFFEYVMDRGLKVNNPEEVKKIQSFLNEHLGKNLPLDGVYSAATVEALKEFQLLHSSEVLAPWRLPAPTGHSYMTTTWWLNMEYCIERGVWLGLSQPSPLLPWSQNPNRNVNPYRPGQLIGIRTGISAAAPETPQPAPVRTVLAEVNSTETQSQAPAETENQPSTMVARAETLGNQHPANYLIATPTIATQDLTGPLTAPTIRPAG